MPPQASQNSPHKPKRKRKPRYDRKIVPIVRACATFGGTLPEIASFLGIERTSLWRWSLEHEELRNALKRGREASDDRAEDSLYQQALAGNPTCLIFWLKNRRPDRWRDVQNIESAVGHYIISDRPMTEQQWIEERCKTLPPPIEGKATDLPHDDSDFGSQIVVHPLSDRQSTDNET